MVSNRINLVDTLGKVKKVLAPERSFYIVSIIYGIGVSVLTLAIPISVQSLVNTVSSTLLFQPLFVLSILLMALLLFSGALRALQDYVLEIFQRHFYARTSSQMATKVLNAKDEEFKKNYGVTLMNRYFEIIAIQKNAATLLTVGVELLLNIIVGFILLAFYHPYFIIFDILMLFLLWGVWRFYGSRAMYTAVMESKAKYSVASWLEELARISSFFKTEDRKAFAISKCDKLINNYLEKRGKHYRLYFSQTVLVLGIYALMGSLILMLGGYLVMQGQLTLGQLVAAELVVAVILSSLAKSNKILVSFYDLYASVDKVMQVYDLKAEDIPNEEKEFLGGDLEFNDVKFISSGKEFKFNYQFQKGKSYIVIPDRYSSKNAFIDVLCRQAPISKGQVLIGQSSFEDLPPLQLRDKVVCLEESVIFDGTIRDNLIAGSGSIKTEEIRSILDIVDLENIEDMFEDGLDTVLLPSGHPLWSSQIFRLTIARILLQKPKILVLTQVFDQLEKKRKKKIWDYISSQDMIVIYINTSYNEDFDHDEVLNLEQNSIVKRDL